MTRWLFIGVLVGIVALAVVVVVQKRAESKAHKAASNRRSVVPASASEFQTRLVAVIGSFGKYKTESPLPGTIVVVQPRYPDWTIIVSILFFPVGLLALLAKTEDRGTIQITAVDENRSDVALSGAFRPKLLASIGDLLGPVASG